MSNLIKNNKINRDSQEFKNFKQVVERNKLKSSSTSIDKIVDTLKQHQIHL